ncbi:hypothetical protein NQD34_006131, partial [Periophthalmus magnuspinnatus]
VAHVDERWHRHQDDLEYPKPHVGQRCEGVVAHVLASWLARVAHKLALLVI